MEPPAVHLERGEERDADILANLIELYAHDLSAAFALDIGPDGRFGYPRLAAYWSDPERHIPWLIRVGTALAGFALVTRGSPATTDPTHLDVAELFVLRRHRGLGVGELAMTRLWDGTPGHWVVRVAACNDAALPFWSRVVTRYTGGRFTARDFEGAGKRWTVFELDT